MLKLFSGRANPALAEKICSYLGIPLGAIEISNFSDGEIYVQIQENVRGRDVFVVQSICHPCNDSLVELLIIIDALKRASAKRITAVIPYYGYARQDRKVQPRVALTAKLLSDLISTAGTDRILTMDLHAGQIQGFFNIPVDHLFAAPVLIDYIRKKNYEDLVVVAPDAGGVERARAFARRIESPMAIIDKRREEKNVAHIMHVIGDVADRRCVIVDDIVDTAGTLAESASALVRQGALSVSACCTHPVLSGQAIERIERSPLEEVIVTDTIPLDSKRSNKIKVLSVANLLGEAIRRIHNETSVSSLFD